MRMTGTPVPPAFKIWFEEEEKMRSDNVKKGAERTPNRSLFYALGYTDEELELELVPSETIVSEDYLGYYDRY